MLFYGGHVLQWYDGQTRRLAILEIWCLACASFNTQDRLTAGSVVPLAIVQLASKIGKMLYF